MVINNSNSEEIDSAGVIPVLSEELIIPNVRVTSRRELIVPNIAPRVPMTPPTMLPTPALDPIRNAAIRSRNAKTIARIVSAHNRRNGSRLSEVAWLMKELDMSPTSPSAR
jgi:hypothetical protein